MTADRVQRQLSDELHREVDGVAVDPFAALAEFPRRLSRRRRQRRGTAVALAAVAAVLVGVTIAGDRDQRALELPVDESDRVAAVVPSGTNAIALGSAPSRVVLSGRTVWAALAGGSIARLNTGSGTLSHIGELPSTPFDLQPTDRWLWVSLPNDKRIVALDPTDGHEVHTVSTASPGPRGLLMAGGSLWATAGNAVLELDPASGRQRRTVALPKAGLPYDVAVSSDSVWVTDSRTTAVSRIRLDGGTVEYIDVQGRSVGIVAVEGTIWVALADSNQLVRLDAATGQEKSRTTLPAPALGLSVIGDEVWAGIPDVNLVMSFDATSGKPTHSWRVGDFPPIVTGDGEAVYVSSNRSNEMIRVPLEQNRSP